MPLNSGAREDSLESLGQRGHQTNPKGNQPWIFIGRTDAEAEDPILWPPDVKRWLIRKDPDAGKDWRQEEKGTTEDEVVWWHHRLSGLEFEQTLGYGEGQGSLACCCPCGRKELDMTEWLNNSNKEKEAIKWKMTFSTHKTEKIHRTFCCSSVTKSCLTLCDSVDCSTPGSLVLHCLSEFFHIHVHWMGDAI